ncbi:hypothetical protein V1522DRAFT_415523 [Lipomyces starkeyi]
MSLNLVLFMSVASVLALLTTETLQHYTIPCCNLSRVSSPHWDSNTIEISSCRWWLLCVIVLLISCYHRNTQVLQ